VKVLLILETNAKYRTDLGDLEEILEDAAALDEATSEDVPR
jgi:hypothetical protein